MAFNKDKCLCVMALQDNTTVGMKYTSQVDGSKYYFSKDGGVTWVAQSITLNANEKAYIKGTNYPSWGDGSSASYNRFTATGRIKFVSGSIMSLVDDGAGAATRITQRLGFAYLFYSCTNLISINRDFFSPITSFAQECFDSLFAYCSSLKEIYVPFTTWPKIYSVPATGDWVKSVASSGTFYCPDALPRTYGDDYIPTKWAPKPPPKPTVLEHRTITFKNKYTSPWNRMKEEEE